MNKINTIQHGSHLNGVLKGYQMFITEKCIKRNKKLEDEDLRKDILNHLHIVVNARCNLAHMFSGQTKYNCISPTLEKAIINATYESLNKNISKELVDQFVDMVIGNHRARVAGEQSRNINKAIKEDKKWIQPKNFIPCSNVKCEFPKELYIVEGNSAGGGLRAARDARFQAIFQARGKTMSTWNKAIEEILKSQVWRDLIKTLGCGIRETFNIKKLKYDKIIISTDADIDGFQIRVLDVAIFVQEYPEIINEGKLYIAEPPLYRLVRGKEHFYVATQNEYIDACIKSIGDIKIEFPQSHINIGTSEFVHQTFDYLTTLRDTAISRNVNAQLLEYVAWGIAINNGDLNKFIKNINKWLKRMTSVYPELGFDDVTNQISAVIDYNDQLVVLDEFLIESLRPIIDVISKYGVMITYKSRKLNTEVTNTLSTFYVDMEKYYPTITNRYKGLGQSPAQVSKEVIMDPRTRRIIRLTMNDALIMQQMAILLAKDKESLNARKDLISRFHFTKNDIDN
jgi:DNA gyrase subunit B